MCYIIFTDTLEDWLWYDAVYGRMRETIVSSWSTLSTPPCILLMPTRSTRRLSHHQNRGVIIRDVRMETVRLSFALYHLHWGVEHIGTTLLLMEHHVDSAARFHNSQTLGTRVCCKVFGRCNRIVGVKVPDWLNQS